MGVKTFKRFFILVFVLAFVVGFGGFLAFRGSLPLLDGEIFVEDLHSPVYIDRDKQGIVTLRGGQREDISFATGFVHASDRFFQMDLMRRITAGELSELFGEKTLPMDKKNRFHQFRKRAKKVLTHLNQKEKNLLASYVKGVNAGLASLHVRPFEYLLLRETPKPWTEEDTILVGFGLFFQLQDDEGKNDLIREVLVSTLPEKVSTFFLKNGSIWQAPLDGSHQPILPIPEKEHFSYLHSDFAEKVDKIHNFRDDLKVGGSNQWAVAPEWTYNMHPILSNDMHLNLNVPNAWYRTVFRYHDKKGHEHFVAGLTLPGAPIMVIGSNTNIAWGFTNAFVDTTDLAILEEDPKDKTRYLTPKGFVPFEKEIELIAIKGEDPYPLEITQTIWGPKLETSCLEKSFAMMWSAHSEEAFNLKIFDLEEATSAENALEMGPSLKIPTLSLMVVDKHGNIGWTLTGAVPKRIGFDGTRAVSLADGSKKWDGFVDTFPILMNPENGRLWTANHRLMGEPWDEILGKEGHLNGIRGFLIRDELMKLHTARPEDMLAIQMSIDGVFFQRWQELLLSLSSSDPHVKKLQEVVASWDGQASENSAAFYWIRLFRAKVIDQVVQRILKPCFLAWKELDPNARDFEEPVFLIVSEQPDYLLDPHFKNWNESLLAILNTVMKEHPNLPGSIEEHTWGKANVLKMGHPLTKKLSFLKLFLNMPEVPLSGDYYTPRVLGEKVGASQRMVVSPGHEEEGMMHLPGGQSGHPLSPFYSAGHQDWLDGVYSPFLPGPTKHTLILSPAN